jgi:DNA-binding MarR family transcriptional regulator
MAYADGRSIGDLIKERNIELASFDPMLRGGFTQIPNLFLRERKLSLGAKVTYALLLSFFWHNNAVFPGQERLGEDMGMSTSRVNEYVKELEKAGYIEITRRGQGKTNLYKLYVTVEKGKVSRSES